MPQRNVKTNGVDGFCPFCAAPGVYREPVNTENRMDKCANGHTYDTSKRLHTEPEAQMIVAVGANPILQDVAQAHEPLTFVRAAVAQAVLQINPTPDTIMSISIMSVGPNIEDQLVVFSPGGDVSRNAVVLHERLVCAAEQIKGLLDDGVFSG